jgi:predicted enzyme related to lactoylglutathione lyase
MTLHTGAITIDCAEPLALAAFWTAALDLAVAGDYGDFVLLLPHGKAMGEAVGIGLQRVPEAKAGKNRVHLDFHTEDREAEVQRLVALGAKQHDTHSVPGLTWTVLSDPDGNEFCVGAAGHP